MHIRSRVVWCACVAALLVSVAGTASANDTAVNGIGGTLMPMESTDIRMAEETIQAHVYGAYAEFVVDFRFENSGDTQTLLLGFPFRLRSDFEIAEGSPGGGQVAGFMAWQDGQPIDVDYEEGKDEFDRNLGYYTHRVTFEPGTTMVRVRYLADTAADSGWPPASVPRPDWARSLEGGMHAWYPYWVHTGAGWAGTIGTTVVRFTLTDDFIGWGVEEALSLDGTAPYTKPSEREYEWTMLDYEPTVDDDIDFSYFSSTLGWRSVDWPAEAAGAVVTGLSASSELTLGEYSYPGWSAFTGVSTAWAEAAQGSGAGEWVMAEFGGPREVSEIRILPGYAKRPDLFYKYNRPKQMTLTFSDGSETTVMLTDEPSLQRFEIDATTTEWVKATIDEVYRGTTRDETYVSLIDAGATSPSYLSFEALLAQAGSGESVDPADTEVALDAETPADTEPTVISETGDASTSSDVESSIGLLLLGIVIGAAAAGVVAWLLVRRRGTSGDA